LSYASPVSHRSVTSGRNTYGMKPSNFKNENRIAVFIDGYSFYHMQKDYLRWFINPKKLLDQVRTLGKVVEAHYYSTINYESRGQVNFMRALGHMGYQVHQQELLIDGEDFNTIEIEMMLDIVQKMDNYDTAILLTNDYAFNEVLKKLKKADKRAILWSVENYTPEPLLKLLNGNFQDVSHLKRQIEKTEQLN